MAEIYKRLGGIAGTTANIADNGATANTWTIISSIVICNQSSSAYTYTISTSQTSASHGGGWIAYNATIAGNDTVVLVAGICLDPSWRYLVASTSNVAVSVNAFGVQGP